MIFFFSGLPLTLTSIYTREFGGGLKEFISEFICLYQVRQVRQGKAGRKGGYLYVESELVSKRWFYIRVFERRMDF